MEAYNFRPGDDGNDPVPIAQLVLLCILAAVVFLGVLKLHGLEYF